MNTTTFKLLRSLAFISVLILKMFIIVSPVFSNNYQQNDIQIEKESKNDKEEAEKEQFKLKDAFDKEYLYLSHHAPVIGLDDVALHNLFLHPIYSPDHLAAVPTPPPDHCLSYL
ncbi:hypothetical protein [Mucilaginibacter celer]|uniref:Uncharacterized protein n=1 Tax=Mucilaginibacter celer TaxID=2305508 RepID=A0A494W1F6_9SPHI|nr:hypothetical protein [Mucilaginibacter celer]AYL97563.1 hypothetical protein HYN43_020690 [Mucilaginibacter celer]